MQVAFSEVRVIGELTTSNGPGPDHFLVLVTREAWFELEFGTPGMDTLLSELQRRFGYGTGVRLANRTGLTSEVWWPPSLERQPAFEFQEQPGRGLWRLVRKVAPLIEQRLAPAVRERALH